MQIPRHVLFAAALAILAPPSLAEVPQADVVILGEVHDNPDHHVWQAEIVAELQPAALVFEMLLPEHGAVVTPELRADPEALAAAVAWAERGWPDFAMYHPIFTAAPSAAIFGAELPRDVVRAALTDGAAAVFGATFEEDPAAFGLDQSLDAEMQAAREALQDAAHCNALPETVLPGMVEAQRLRDAAIARAVIAAHAATGGPVAVITGTGHARTDWGVPAVLALAAPDLSVHSTGQIESEPEDGAPFDKTRVTAPAERDDPCAAFH